MKVLVIPDVHLKPWMFKRAAEIMDSENIDRAVCLMDIPDDWNQEYNVALYEETFDAAITFQKNHPETLWCYGNHDLSYVWMQTESGFSTFAMFAVADKISELKETLPDRNQMQFIHRIDNVLFLHGGLSHAFVKYYAASVDYEDVDAVLEIINNMGCNEMWDDASPLWLRPQVDIDKMYKQDEMLQVVGHTPVESITMDWNLISCDTFCTYPDGSKFGSHEFLVIDTQTWNYYGIKAGAEAGEDYDDY